MLRALTLAATVSGALGQSTCRFNRTAEICPAEGAPCNQNVLCQAGLYCKVESVGTNAAGVTTSFSGFCRKGPAMEDVYAKPCQVGVDYKSCQFQNPLALSPRVQPNSLRCIKSFPTDSAGSCRLGPNKHGDGCNLDGECASGVCMEGIKQCKGVDEGEACTPGYPDPCQPGHYCKPETTSAAGGVCVKSVSAGRSCSSATACERGSYCAGADLASRTCRPLFSVPTGANTTIGPYMCATANAVLVKAGATAPESVYQCVDANSTLVGTPCRAGARAPLGYECKCSADGSMRLRTLGGLGLGGRSQAWRDLAQCLATATNPTNVPCEFDSLDLEQVRFGSCAFYACHPYYLRLVNATGGRPFSPPLDQFETSAQCETAAASSYYASVASTPCIAIPGMENWKCATINASSMSVENTVAVVLIIFAGIFLGYFAHMYVFRGKNPGHPLPFWFKYIPGLKA